MKRKPPEQAAINIYRSDLVKLTHIAKTHNMTLCDAMRKILSEYDDVKVTRR